LDNSGRTKEITTVWIRNARIPVPSDGELYYLSVEPQGISGTSTGSVRVAGLGMAPYSLVLDGSRAQVVAGQTYYFLREPVAFPLINSQSPGDVITLRLYDINGPVAYTLGNVTDPEQNMSVELAYVSRVHGHALVRG
jgi:hypothetical protein